MAHIGMLPVILRETLGKRTLPREPEPDLIMADAEQVAAYTEAGRIDGVMSASYLFQSAQISQVIRGCRRVVDIGCGPATQLGQIAQLNPEISFLGVDLSDEMLSQAERHVRDLGLKNVEFLKADMTDLRGIETGAADGVISTMALHHLPTRAALEGCFTEIRRILKSGGALYLVDFGRLKSLKSIIYFAYMNAGNQPHIFSLDYERSLRAAFLPEEFGMLMKEIIGAGASMLTTYPVPILVLIRTNPKSTDTPDLSRRLRAMRAALPARYRQDLDLIRRLFRLGGMDNDPFR